MIRIISLSLTIHLWDKTKGGDCLFAKDFERGIVCERAAMPDTCKNRLPKIGRRFFDWFHVDIADGFRLCKRRLHGSFRSPMRELSCHLFGVVLAAVDLSNHIKTSPTGQNGTRRTVLPFAEPSISRTEPSISRLDRVAGADFGARSAVHALFVVDDGKIVDHCDRTLRTRPCAFSARNTAYLTYV